MNHNEIPPHVLQRIAESVGNGWPAYDVDPTMVSDILEAAQELGTQNGVAIAIRLGRIPVMAVEAVLAEAVEYGLVPA